METLRLQRDWADLPEELVTIIGEKITTNTAYIYLRFVCKAWRRALTPKPRHLPPQSPWLLLPGIRDGFELDFYDPFQSKFHRFQCPYMRGKDICGSSHGWLVLEDDLRVSLFNPITQCSLDLPPFNAPPSILISLPQGWRHYPYQNVMKATVSCNPFEDGCVVVVQFRTMSKWELAFCRIGDTHWTGLLLQDMYGKGQMLFDFTCHKNLVYTVNGNMVVSVHDLHNLSWRTFPSKISYNWRYDRVNIVKRDLESGEPLVVKTTDFCGTKMFCVYKWFDDSQRWFQVHNIGKQVLFLNWGHCISLLLGEGRGNQLYHSNFLPEAHYRVGIYQVDLKSGKDFMLNQSPELPYLIPGSPIWLLPSLI
ncbi:hypothetical protein LUZ61_003252 [Rhynchospora tenuis]|uniref:KIB1-4 beta-propeller domain-containing protein n=1 Tax=Rhynchospora tenuis TaxID=198213 RepID=A0AAD5ZKG7_9POAL|nr:hypothetical protein LUZ61_003252 [Rhynchospora tenuis]